MQGQVFAYDAASISSAEMNEWLPVVKKPGHRDQRLPRPHGGAGARPAAQRRLGRRRGHADARQHHRRRLPAVVHAGLPGAGPARRQRLRRGLGRGLPAGRRIRVAQLRRGHRPLQRRSARDDRHPAVPAGAGAHAGGRRRAEGDALAAGPRRLRRRPVLHRVPGGGPGPAVEPVSGAGHRVHARRRRAGPARRAGGPPHPQGAPERLLRKPGQHDLGADRPRGRRRLPAGDPPLRAAARRPAPRRQRVRADHGAAQDAGPLLRGGAAGGDHRQRVRHLREVALRPGDGRGRAQPGRPGRHVLVPVRCGPSSTRSASPP